MVSGLIGMGPNPIRSNLTINFGLAKRGDVRIEIYSLKGECVYRFINTRMHPGYHKVIWNRTGRTGQRISNGTYLIRVQIKDLVCKKLVTVIR